MGAPSLNEILNSFVFLPFCGSASWSGTKLKRQSIHTDLNLNTLFIETQSTPTRLQFQSVTSSTEGYLFQPFTKLVNRYTRQQVTTLIERLLHLGIYEYKEDLLLVTFGNTVRCFKQFWKVGKGGREPTLPTLPTFQICLTGWEANQWKLSTDLSFARNITGKFTMDISEKKKIETLAGRMDFTTTISKLFIEFKTDNYSNFSHDNFRELIFSWKLSRSCSILFSFYESLLQ